MKRTKEKTIDVDFLLSGCELNCLYVQGCVYLKLVELRNVNYFMAVAKIVVCLVSFDGNWQRFSLAWEVVGGIYEWECERTYLRSYIS
jgi:hypothetical protein